MGIFVAGFVVGGFLYLVGKAMEYDERKRLEKPPRPRASPLVTMAWIAGLVAFAWFIAIPAFDWFWEAVVQGWGW